MENEHAAQCIKNNEVKHCGSLTECAESSSEDQAGAPKTKSRGSMFESTLMNEAPAVMKDHSLSWRDVAAKAGKMPNWTWIKFCYWLLLGL